MPGVCTVNHTTVSLWSIALWALLFSGSVHAADSLECTCAPSHLASSFSSAHQIFEGTIVTAELDDEHNSVAFSVDVDNVFRGTVETIMKLTTPLKHACRVSVYVGARSVFIIGKENRAVSLCDGPFESTNTMAPFFSSAIDLVENYGVVRQRADGDIQQRLKTGANATAIRHILTMAQKLDPESAATNTIGALSYRGLVVRLNDDRVVSYDWQ